MIKDLFYKISLIIQYTLGNKINRAILVDTYATQFDFINEKFAEIICQTLKIEFQCLTKP